MITIIYSTICLFYWGFTGEYLQPEHLQGDYIGILLIIFLLNEVIIYNIIYFIYSVIKGDLK